MRSRYGESIWRRLLPGRPRPEASSRPERALRPAGAEAALEDRKLLSLTVSTFEAPAVQLSGQGVTKGSDGNFWFTEPGKGKIGRMTPKGAVTEFPLPNGHSASNAITSGPDGNLWFTEGDRVGRMTTAGAVTEFTVAPGAHLTGITSGSDGNLWFMDTDHFKIGRMTTSGAVDEFPIPPATTLKSQGSKNLFHDITSGPDGNVWYTAEIYDRKSGVGRGEIGRVTPEGKVTTYLLPKGPQPKGLPSFASKTKLAGFLLADAITSGPDGNVWFTEHQGFGIGAIGKITPSGQITQYKLPTTPLAAKQTDIATDIISGPDGNLWFNLATNNFAVGPTPSAFVGRITPSGAISVYPIPHAKDTQAALVAEGAESMVSGPDGRVWFTGVSRRFDSSTGRVLGAITPPAKP